MCWSVDAGKRSRWMLIGWRDTNARDTIDAALSFRSPPILFSRNRLVKLINSSGSRPPVLNALFRLLNVHSRVLCHVEVEGLVEVVYFALSPVNTSSGDAPVLNLRPSCRENYMSAEGLLLGEMRSISTHQPPGVSIALDIDTKLRDNLWPALCDAAHCD